MKIFYLIFIVCGLLNATAFSQAKPNQFVYIQSETKEPFYVLINSTNYSSSPSGFLILPKLQSGVLNFAIGFARDKYPEQKFVFTIADNDLGFSLRVNNSKRWELFNLQELIVLSEVTNLTENKVAIKPVEQAVAAPVNLPEKSIITSPSNTITSIVPIDSIVKATNTVTETGVTQVYIDKADTITIFIPKETSLATDTPAKEIATAKVDKSVKNCTFATNDDFIKIRAKMAGLADEKDMLIVGAQAFKDKCFSVEQVKYLSYLVITEENKLAFLLSAQKTVYDAYNYPSLQSLLMKPSVIQQFRNALQ
ncbi:MAG: hypothetical protein H7101_11455 [Deinococcales bacterium]|nr:hypothetical protein [Chitinophagaceae bacterium]